MLVGIPCVTTNAGAISEVAIDDVTALVVPKEHALALAGAIDRLLNDAELGRRLAAVARKRTLEKFTLDVMLDRMEEVFRRASDERRS